MHGAETSMAARNISGKLVCPGGCLWEEATAIWQYQIVVVVNVKLTTGRRIARVTRTEQMDLENESAA